MNAEEYADRIRAYLAAEREYEEALAVYESALRRLSRAKAEMAQHKPLYRGGKFYEKIRAQALAAAEQQVRQLP